MTAKIIPINKENEELKRIFKALESIKRLWEDISWAEMESHLPLQSDNLILLEELEKMDNCLKNIKELQQS
ncbi:MAG: hypothetical protein D4R73_11155 [Deltaproteobacteria bacterium]|nr:MAG: hypothetical protein D4R73_11155 [Deltaproteobacteria bacterium]